MTPILDAADPDRMEHLERMVQRLRAWAMISTVAILGVLVVAFHANTDGRFTELTAERLNITTPDGRRALILSTADRLPGNVMNGRERKPEGRRGSGMIFYDMNGNEAGGLVFNNQEDAKGVSAGSQLSLDRFEGDQVAALRYVESPGEWSAGLQISHFTLHGIAEWHRGLDSIDRLPAASRDSAHLDLARRFYREGKWETPRLFVGERGRDAVVEMRDTRGRQRIRMVVDSLDVARIEFLNDSGRIVRRIPDLE